MANICQEWGYIVLFVGCQVNKQIFMKIELIIQTGVLSEIQIKIKEVNSIPQISEEERKEIASKGLKISEKMLSEFSDEDLANLAQEVSDTIAYEIKRKALLLPKTPEDILKQIKAKHFVMLPSLAPDTKEFAGFHRVTNCYDIYNKHGLNIVEVGSLVGNHQITTNPSKEQRHVVFPDFYEYNPNFTPGALVLQMAVEKTLRGAEDNIPMILATSRADASTRALREAGFRMVDWGKYPMIGATTCDPSCVGECWVGCSPAGVACHAKGILTKKDMCKLFVHESYSDKMLDEAETKLRSAERDPLQLRIRSNLALSKE